MASTASILLTSLVLNGCGDGGSTAVTPSAAALFNITSGVKPTSTPKPVLVGLVSMGKSSQNASAPPANTFAELNAHPGVYVAAVVDLFWSQLEPARMNFDDGALESALASLSAYNAAHPGATVRAKLRIFAGAGTPSWVIAGAGGVSATDDSTGATYTVGRFWTSTYQTYWRELQAHLAARYDVDPRIAEVAISSCSTATAEPFILPAGPQTIANLHAAGYSDMLGMACLTAAPGDYAAWTLTPLDFTFNAFTATDSGQPSGNTVFPTQLMTAFRANLGLRGVVANHGLQSPLAAGAMPIYAQFQALYATAQGASPPMISPLEFQTISPVVDWPSAISLALTYHPTEIEVWDTTAAGGAAPLTQQQLASSAASIHG